MASSLLPQKFMQVFLFLSLSLLLFSLSDRLNEQQSYYVSKFTQQMANLQFLQDLYTTKQNLHLNKLILNLYIKQTFKYLLGWQCNKQLYTTKKSILAFELWFRKKKTNTTAQDITILAHHPWPLV